MSWICIDLSIWNWSALSDSFSCHDVRLNKSPNYRSTRLFAALEPLPAGRNPVSALEGENDVNGYPDTETKAA